MIRRVFGEGLDQVLVIAQVYTSKVAFSMGCPRFSTNTAMTYMVAFAIVGFWSIIPGISRLLASAGVGWVIQVVAMRVLALPLNMAAMPRTQRINGAAESKRGTNCL